MPPAPGGPAERTGKRYVTGACLNTPLRIRVEYFWDSGIYTYVRSDKSMSDAVLSSFWWERAATSTAVRLLVRVYSVVS